MSDKYWAEVAARKAAGQKISVDDAVAGKVQMDMMRNMAQGAGIDSDNTVRGSAVPARANHTDAGGGSDWWALPLLFAIFGGYLLFYLLPSSFITAVEAGRIARSVLLGVAMLAAYSGIAVAIWLFVRSGRRDARERAVRYADADRQMEEKAQLVWNEWGELVRLYHNSFSCSVQMKHRLLARIIELGGRV